MIHWGEEIKKGEAAEQEKKKKTTKLAPQGSIVA